MSRLRYLNRADPMMLQTFTAPSRTVFHHNASYSGDAHIAPSIGEPSVEVPIDGLVAFVAHVVTERHYRTLGGARVTGILDPLERKWDA